MEKRPPRFHRRPKDPGNDDGDDKDLNKKTLQRKNKISPTEQQQQQQWQQHTTSISVQQSNSAYKIIDGEWHILPLPPITLTPTTPQRKNEISPTEQQQQQQWQQRTTSSSVQRSNNHNNYHGAMTLPQATTPLTHRRLCRSVQGRTAPPPTTMTPTTTTMPLTTTLLNTLSPPIPPPSMSLPSMPLPSTSVSSMLPPTAHHRIVPPQIEPPPIKPPQPCLNQQRRTCTNQLRLNRPRRNRPRLNRPRRKRPRNHRPRSYQPRHHQPSLQQPSLTVFPPIKLPPLMEYEEQLHSAIAIQSLCRGAMARAGLLLAHTCATKVQRHVRGHFSLHRCLETRYNIPRFGLTEELLADIMQDLEHEEQMDSAIGIQALCCGAMVRAKLSLAHACATEVQRHVRGYFSAARYLEAQYNIPRFGFTKELLADIETELYGKEPPQPIPPNEPPWMIAGRTDLRLCNPPSPPPQPWTIMPKPLTKPPTQPLLPPPLLPVPPPLPPLPPLPPPPTPMLSWSLLPQSPLPALPVAVPPAMQPLQFQVLTYCDDFVEYSLYHDENETARLIERIGMNVLEQGIKGNHKMEETQDDTNQRSIDRDETSTDNSKTKERRNGKPRSKKQEFKEYTKVYIYQRDHYKKSRKRASRQDNKCKTKDGKFLEGPAKDDDTYMSSNSGASKWGRTGQPTEPRRIARKVSRRTPRKTRAAIRRWNKKKRLIGRKARKDKSKKRVLAIQSNWSGQTKWRYPECRVLVQVTIPNGSRVWDAERKGREGGGGPARVAKFRDRSTQQLGSAADSTPVVL
jgi:IQ calmodulin-binding motif